MKNRFTPSRTDECKLGAVFEVKKEFRDKPSARERYNSASMRASRVARFLTLVFLTVAAPAQNPPTQKRVLPANYDEAKVGTYTLPDPLVFNDGKPVRTPADWSKRRAEIVRMFEDDVFGHSPKPRAIRYEVFDEDRHALGGTAIRKQVTIYFSGRKDGPKEDVLIYLPASAHGPVPLILTLNFRGNQAVVSDPAVRLPTLWNARTHQLEPATEASRGTNRQFDVEKVIKRGYSFATIYYQGIWPLPRSHITSATGNTTFCRLTGSNTSSSWTCTWERSDRGNAGDPKCAKSLRSG